MDDILASIEAMRQQEDASGACYNYLTNENITIDESSRSAMVTYLQQVEQTLKFSPETTWIAISYLDRYLSSGRGNSHSALHNKYQFQLLAITCFYISTKLFEDVELSPLVLSKLCKGYYAAHAIRSMEEEVLFALNWRMAYPTPMEFVREYIKLLPDAELLHHQQHQHYDGALLQRAVLERVAYSSSDMYFTFCSPSVVGVSALTSVLISGGLLSKTQRQDFYFLLARSVNLIDVMEAQVSIVLKLVSLLYVGGGLLHRGLGQFDVLKFSLNLTHHDISFYTIFLINYAE